MVLKKIILSKYFSFYLSGTFILILVAIYFIHLPFQLFIDQTFDVIISEDKDRTREYFKQFGIWGPLAIIVFIVAQMFLIVFPTILTVIIAVMAYGFWLGILISLIGIVIASTIGYFIGVNLKRAFINKLLGEKNLEKMVFWISNYSFGIVVLFRISPFLSTDAISFIAGMLRMDYKKYMLATLTGMIPLSMAIGYFAEDISTLEDGLFWIGGVGFILYAVYIFIDYRRKKRIKEKFG